MLCSVLYEYIQLIMSNQQLGLASPSPAVTQIHSSTIHSIMSPRPQGNLQSSTRDLDVERELPGL
ncbi:hypothetical protein BJX99DRAFT_239999 [Aspergillus californicus]